MAIPASVAQLGLGNLPTFGAGWRSLQPLAYAEYRYWKHNEETLRQLRTLTQEHVDAVTDNDLDDLIEALQIAWSRIDGYLRVRGETGFFPRRLVLQRGEFGAAVECLKRGYAPGMMPSERQRVESLDSTLRSASF